MAFAAVTGPRKGFHEGKTGGWGLWSEKRPTAGTGDSDDSISKRRGLAAWLLAAGVFPKAVRGHGEVVDVYGPNPRGAIVFGAGQMAVVIAAAGRAPPKDEAGLASALRGMMAYTGRYTVEQDQIVTEVDAAWHPAWEDTRQPRFFKLEGDRLTLTTPVQVHPLFPGRPGRGVVVFAREH